METLTHDPSEYIRSIQQILISGKNKTGVLFGAGNSLAYRNEKSLTVPAIFTAFLCKFASHKSHRL